MDLNEIAINQQNKFDYTFAGLIFATLALSLRFPTESGLLFPYILIAAWLVLFISGFLAGLRLMHLHLFYSLNDDINKLRNFIIERSTHLANPSFVASALKGNVLDNDNLEPFTAEALKNDLEASKAKKEKLRLLMESKNKRFNLYFNIQIWTYVLGVLLNGAFLSLNLLNKANLLPSCWLPK